jgi:hypothetical protein
MPNGSESKPLSEGIWKSFYKNKLFGHPVLLIMTESQQVNTNIDGYQIQHQIMMDSMNYQCIQGDDRSKSVAFLMLSL